ncbi:hypothetical protein ACTXG7_08145 [Mycolicibacterium sp. Dal123E01]|uniref:hypothetical protein n=1 Tax=Mycolicibacterium sp. Dal123E01 TaxID=3457578 RepID=UPI00403E92AE
MAVVRVNFLPEFYLGDDALLLTLDGDGAELFKSAVEEARINRSARLLHSGVAHEFRIELGASRVELTPERVVWRLDDAKAAEIAEDLATLSASHDERKAAGHFYVDMTSPAETLVISRDEYADVVYPWVAPPQG